MEYLDLSQDSHDPTDQVPTLWMDRPELDDHAPRSAALALFPASERLSPAAAVARDLLDHEPVTTVRGRVAAPQRLFPDLDRQPLPRSSTNVNVTARGAVAARLPAAIDPEVARVRARAEAVAASRPTIPRVVAGALLHASPASALASGIADTALASPVVDEPLPEELPPAAEPARRTRSRKHKGKKRPGRRAVRATGSVEPAVAPFAVTAPAQPTFGTGMLSAHSRIRPPSLASLPSPAGSLGASDTLPRFGAGVLRQQGGSRAWLYAVLAVAAVAAIYLVFAR